MYKVYSDEGHGGGDSGAVGFGIMEKNLVVPISTHYINYLEKHNIKTSRSRNGDYTVNLSERSNRANKFNADIFVSHHINSFGTSSPNGVEVLYNPKSSNGKRLAKLIVDELYKTGLFKNNRGIKARSNLSVLNRTTMPAVIVEYGFISNKDELSMIRSNQEKLAEATGRATLKYFNIKEKEEVKKPHWAERHYENLSKKIDIHEKRFDDFVTRGELFAILDRLDK